METSGEQNNERNDKGNNEGNNEPKPESPAELMSIWKLSNLSWRTLGKRVWLEIYEGSMLAYAAALSFYFLLALFPLILFLITILGFFAESGTELRSQLLVILSRVVPVSASALIYTTVDEIGQNADGSKLSFGILTALWVASSGMGAISEALNAMYGVKESRPWWKVRIGAVALTVALAVLIISALLLILYGGDLGAAIAEYFNQGEHFVTFWVIAQVPVVLAFVLLTFAMIYYFAPNVH
ncbi:MAG TPA: YihY/virulence factor BrkB family protein, partial [Pyrinomonadaceae bacterium]